MKYILTADLHLQYHSPICRTDNFIDTQIKKLGWLSELAKKHKATILCAGDVTHKAREDRQNELHLMLHNNLPEMYGVLGNHDTISRNSENVYKSALGLHIKTSRYKLLSNVPTKFGDDSVYGADWGDELPHVETSNNLGIIHKFILGPNDPLQNYVSGTKGRKLLREYPEYDLILTGDNHQTFTFESKGRFLVNPGSFLRITSAQKEFEPSVFLYDSEKHTLEQIYIPIDHGVISDEHIKEKVSVDFGAYIESLKNSDVSTFEFIPNVITYMQTNNISNKKLDEYIS